MAWRVPGVRPASTFFPQVLRASSELPDRLPEGSTVGPKPGSSWEAGSQGNWGLTSSGAGQDSSAQKLGILSVQISLKIWTWEKPSGWGHLHAAVTGASCCSPLSQGGAICLVTAPQDKPDGSPCTSGH
ncbi:uncharacterized protein encoded by LINC01561 [Pan paniscus]|uniref:uncharacterized protein encoded by LINC01561 n=1 Tax=Pan paniscus TaxID=9597 RepID=UPI0025465714|nr:uncharacterized protein encoded by LINC01561 [Pan paniscus]